MSALTLHWSNLGGSVRQSLAKAGRFVCLSVVLAAAGVLLGPGASRAGDVQSYTLDTYLQWLKKYKDAKPAFKPGDVLTAKDLDKLRPFVPPGWLEEMNFPEFRMHIVPRHDNTPRRDYVACSEKYQSQVRLEPDGAMSNYVCGQPFPNSALSPSDPQSGMKAAWNNNFRWQNYGLTKCAPVVTWARFPGSHKGYAPDYGLPPSGWQNGVGGFVFEHPKSAAEIAGVYGGGGSLQRTLGMFYSRLYYTHLAPLADKGATLPVPGAKEFEYKEFDGFFRPFDIRGTAFLIYRYSDPHRADNSWAYLPALRRVRRISVEVKSDSLLGTDHTLEDFYSFSGRPLDWKWRFLGWKDLLVVMNSKHDFIRSYGPKGIMPDDDWQLRRFALVLRTPNRPRPAYSGVINFWDADNWDAFWMVAFDLGGKLWKLWVFPHRWTEDYDPQRLPFLASINRGVHTTNWSAVNVIDVQNSRGTVWPCYCGYAVPDVKKLNAFLDVTTLDRFHR